MPEEDCMQQILQAAFWASMRTEEQRALSFRIAYCTPSDVTSSTENSRPPLHFAKATPLTAGELVRLSPALDFRQSLLGVCRRSALDLHGEGDTVVVWGIVDTGLSWWEHTRGEPKRRVLNSPPPDCFTVSSGQPGTLDISRRGRVLLRLRNGEIAVSIPNVLLTGPVGRFFAEPAERLLRETCDELGVDFSGFDPSTKHDADMYYLKFLERLISSMREHSHGGTILFVSDDWDLNEPRLKQRLLIKFPTSASSTWELLRATLKKWHRSLLSAEEAFAADSLSREHFLDFVINRHQREQSEDLVRDRAGLLAALTRVDGCLVLKRNLDLLGFGAEIICAAPELDTVVFAQDADSTEGDRIPIQRFGTRHRSAFRFCHSDDQLVAVILSSDGDLRVVKKSEPTDHDEQEVIVFNGLDNPELGL